MIQFMFKVFFNYKRFSIFLFLFFISFAKHTLSNEIKPLEEILDDNNDYGGVHINSGVQNHWFYLLSQGGSGVNDNGDSYSVSGIGINQALEIAYALNSVKFDPGTAGRC